MDYKEMNQVLANLDQATNALEETYMENEGEITEETEQMEQEISGLQELLTTEGIDLLGGWLKAKEDKKKSLKAEKDYITRQMSAIDETIEFIKGKISQVMVATLFLLGSADAVVILAASLSWIATGGCLTSNVNDLSS